ncbi:FkbM family methyltransferase [Candidatus Latescibacterota bacterium]
MLSKRSHLHTTGWIESIKRDGPYRSDGSGIPWMNYQTVQFLEKRLKSDFTLFEYGSGFSTRFWAGHVKQVISVEYDKHWFSAVKENIPEIVTLIFREKDVDGDYCRTIIEMNRLFDIVIVDGRDRVNCVKQSINALTERGVIVLDDSQRKPYREAVTFACENGFRALDFEGLKPTEFRTHRTTILYRDNNCLDI